MERQLQLDPTLGGLTEGGVRAACTEGDTNFLASAVYPPRTPDTHPGLDDEDGGWEGRELEATGTLEV